MIEAIGSVTEQLPAAAKSAAAVAYRYLTGAAKAEEVIAERVRLWRAIEGRDQSHAPDVLKIRTAICVLHPMDSGATAETLEYFFEFWRQAGLPQSWDDNVASWMVVSLFISRNIAAWLHAVPTSSALVAVN